MFDSTVIEVAIGIVFCYAAVGLIVSQVNEAIASGLKLRARTLFSGVKLLLNDAAFTGLAKELYNHALVNPQDSGRAQTERALSYKPSYIEPKQFAAALIDVLQKAPPAGAQLNQAIGGIGDAQLKLLLQGMYARSAGDLQKFQNELAVWFDSAMERVAGEYKRRSQLLCFVIAFVIAGAFNIDSFYLFKSLWQHPAIAAGVGSPAALDVAGAVESMKALPIGWTDFPPACVTCGDSLLRLAGWLVTASSVLFGAPFWFDLLGKLIQLRGSGRKPQPL